MPYLRVFIPETSVDKKRDVANALTDAVQVALQMPAEARDWTTIHFISYQPGDLAVGGKLVADGQSPEYFIDYIDMEIGRPTKDDLARGLTAALCKSLGLQPTELGRINFRFHPSSPDDVAMGGHSVRELLAR